MKNNPRIIHLKIFSRGKKKGGIRIKLQTSACFKISDLFPHLFIFINGLFVLGFSSYFHVCAFKSEETENVSTNHFRKNNSQIKLKAHK